MGTPSTLPSPTPASLVPSAPATGPAESDAHQIARAYALDILALAPGPTTDAIVDGAVHRSAGRRARPPERAKVHDAVREEAYRRQSAKAPRVRLALVLIVLTALVLVAVVGGLGLLDEDDGAAAPSGPAVVQGKVIDENGDPASELQVTATDLDGTAVAEVVTDDDGTFVIGDLADGGYVLVVTDGGAQPEQVTADVFVQPGDDVEVSIVFDAQ